MTRRTYCVPGTAGYYLQSFGGTLSERTVAHGQRYTLIISPAQSDSATAADSGAHVP